MLRGLSEYNGTAVPLSLINSLSVVNTVRTPTVSIGNDVCVATSTPPSGTILAESGLSQGYSRSVLRDYGTRQLVNTLDQATKYSYKVKIINPNKKSESIVRQSKQLCIKI